MQYVDVFNGDADGLCALHQLRLAEPRDARLITGVKRDIGLLRRVPPGPDVRVTVLDVSLDQNRQALVALLQSGAAVEYFDHHFAGDIPAHPGLRCHIDTSAQVCTSLLVDRHLGGAHRAWAVVGAFGDNLAAAARRLAGPLVLTPVQLDLLRALGESLNYNAYVDHEADLIVHPARLYEILHRHVHPFGVMDQEPVLRQIADTRRQDLALAQSLPPFARCGGGRVFVLPDAAWSRRVRGAWGNQLAEDAPTLAHAVLVPADEEAFVVSVRAPQWTMQGAEVLCRQFPGGGGRAAAAGINQLPQEQLADFVRAFERIFDQPPRD